MLELVTSFWNAIRYLKLVYPFVVFGLLWNVWRLPRSVRGRKPALLAFAALFALSWLPVAWLNNYALEAPYRATARAVAVDAIVVLSGAAAPPTPSFPYAVMLESTVRRTRQAAYLAQELPGTPVLTCGPRFPSAPDYPSVAHEMGEMLIGWGIESERIWLEEMGVSTASQSIEAAKLLRERGVRRILLVTDAAHMRRAAGCFRKAGFETIAAPSHVHSRSSPPRFVDFLPSPVAVLLNEEALREWLALAVYKARGVI